MSGNQLSISNVINISVSAAQSGAGEYNTSNLAIFTQEVYNPSSFGALGYKIYLSPEEVGEDFGTASQTYADAVEIFSQKPNILAGNGYLVVIPLVEAIQNFSLSGIPSSGTFTLTYGGNASAAINWNDTASQIQAKLRAVTGLSQVVVTGSLASELFHVDFQGIYSAVPLLTVGGSGLHSTDPSDPDPIIITATTSQIGETLAAAVSRTQSLVQYFGVISTLILSQVDALALGAVIATLNKIAGVVYRDSAQVQPGGIIDLLRTGGLTQTRGLYYGSDNDSDALSFLAAYFGRGLSTDFSGSNTTSTMHLKDLIGVQPDPTMTQTILTLCQTAGADVYVSIQGVPKVFCSGANSFFDQVYNLRWIVGALQVAGFNYLAQSATKVPQTENGMDGLKSAYRDVCDLAVTNAYVAPGVWNSSTTFGNQANFLANVSQVGYYIYSLPISQQLQSSREQRIAPLVQIAVKEAGAIHKSNVIIFVNA